ncbi:MAG: carboxynorspermidine decarboxylase [Rickettsiales bacterium]
MRPAEEFPRHHIPAPAYIVDIRRIKENMRKAERIKRESGARMLLATKAFSLTAAFPYMIDALDGTTASGAYEARLGKTYFGKEVHCYSPAYAEADVPAILEYADHLYFNSVSQLLRFGDMAKRIKPSVKLALRVNAGLSQAKNPLYDPSSPGCRFGARQADVTPEMLAKLDALHFHNLCENMAEDGVALMRHISATFAKELECVSEVNFGGGHFYSHENFNADIFIEELRHFQQQHNVQAILEPGAAHVLNSGYLSATVLDIVDNAGVRTAMLNVSASAHMPDVLEVPYTPPLVGAEMVDEADAPFTEYDYLLGGNTCMSGDVIGRYRFHEPLKIGQTLLFGDLMQYAAVKYNYFNGVPLPSLVLWEGGDDFRVVRNFSYDDYARHIGAQ